MIALLVPLLPPTIELAISMPVSATFASANHLPSGLFPTKLFVKLSTIEQHSLPDCHKLRT